MNYGDVNLTGSIDLNQLVGAGQQMISDEQYRAQQAAAQRNWAGTPWLQRADFAGLPNWATAGGAILAAILLLRK